MIEPVVISALLVIAIGIVIFEYRIMRKPAAQRSAREQRFIASDRRVGKAWKSATTRVAPILSIVLFALLLLVSIPLWIDGDVSAAVTITIIAILGIVGMLMLLRFVVARQRTPEWKEQQDSAQARADEAGYPRFFINGRAGIGLGTGFTVLGAVLLVVQLILGGPVSDIVLPVIILVVGVLAILAAVSQRRGGMSGEGEK